MYHINNLKKLNKMKTATLIVSIGQEKAMFNASNDIKEHYRIKLNYRSDNALKKRLKKYTTKVQSHLSRIASVISFELSK